MLWLQVWRYNINVLSSSAAEANLVCLTSSLIRPLKRSTMPLVCGWRGGHRRSRSTISRELRRNAAAQGYKPARAHERARARQKARRNARQHSYNDKHAGGDLTEHLRCQKVRRKRYGSGQERRGTLKGRVCIEQRPAIAQARGRIGDWEGDTVIGKGRQGMLVTLVERKSRYTLAQQLDCRHSCRGG